ncbi:MAG: hypothetical protein WD061_01730 [Candidatus Saccharimonadales bacterium]
MNPNLKINTNRETLHNTGLAVFRPVDADQARELSLAFHEKTRTEDTSILSVRGLGEEKDLAVNLLSLRETKANRAIGSLAVDAASESIYSQLYSLRETYEVNVVDTEIIKTGRFIHAALILDREKIATEIQAIADVLRSMASVAIEESLGLYSKTPHVSLGKATASLNSRGRKRAESVLESIAPSTISLERARIYSPRNRKNGRSRYRHQNT